MITFACLLIISGTALFILFTGGKETTSMANDELYDNLYVCAMHPWEAAEGTGSCSICGMKMSKVEGHQPGTPLPDIENLYVNSNDPLLIHEMKEMKHGSGMDLIPITESPLYQPLPEHDAGEKKLEQSQESEKTLWTCGMHPEVISEEPGICPICHMDLTPLKSRPAEGGRTTIEIDSVTRRNIGLITELVELRDLSLTVRSNGVVKAAEDKLTEVNARVSGWVEKLYVNQTGIQVAKGEPLYELYSPELVSAQEEYLIVLKMAENLGSVSRTGEYDKATEIISAAKRRLELWNISPQQIAALESSGEIKNTMTIVSPADGFILRKNIVEGSAVMPGMELFQITDLSDVWVIAQIFEYEMSWIKAGDGILITSAYDLSLEIHGEIDYIYPTVDPISRTGEARIALPNSDYRLKPDMYLIVTIFANTRRNAVSVSKQAVIRSGKRDIVFVDIGDGRFEPREVHLGLETDMYYEITHNLKAGEKVVTSAQFLLDSEAKLQEAIQKRLELNKMEGEPAQISDEQPHQSHIY